MLREVGDVELPGPGTNFDPSVASIVAVRPDNSDESASSFATESTV
jgi:hypothetical protein